MVHMIRVVQLRRGSERRVALVDEPRLRLLANVETLYELAGVALARSRPLMALVEDSVSPLKPLSDDALDYDAVYAGKSAWRKPKSPACTSSIMTAAHGGSAWRQATSFPITRSKKRIT